MHGGRELGGKWSRDLAGQVLVARPNAFSPSPPSVGAARIFLPRTCPAGSLPSLATQGPSPRVVRDCFAIPKGRRCAAGIGKLRFERDVGA